MIGHLPFERTAVSKKPDDLIAADIAALRDDDRMTQDPPRLDSSRSQTGWWLPSGTITRKLRLMRGRRHRRGEPPRRGRKDNAMTSVEVRRSLVEAVKLDLVGPENGSDLEHEVLSQAPSRWYLTGFLVPLEASESQRSDETADDEMDGAADEAGGTDDAHEPEKPAARRALLPSSMGLSLLISPETKEFKVLVRWGDYSQEIRRGRHESSRGRAGCPIPWSDPAARQRPCDLEAHTS